MAEDAAGRGFGGLLRLPRSEGTMLDRHSVVLTVTAVLRYPCWRPGGGKR